MSTLLRSTCLLLVVVGAAACNSEDRRSPPPAKDVSPALTKATQADLAAELADADRLGTWSEVRRRWQGQALRWRVTRHAMLCRTADACHVAAFPVERPAKHGWMPGLSFAPGQFAALEARCGDRPTCEVTIEGTLARLEVSGELPTNLAFTNVRIVDDGAMARR
jgi:hypothetical protein